MKPKTGWRPRGPADPDRPNRIASAALQVIVAEGLPALTHRAVAERAQVPLSSTTYYFKSLDDLVEAAMTHAVEGFAKEISDWAATVTPETLISSLARLVADRSATPSRRRSLAVSFELYLRALHQPALRPLSQKWDDLLIDTLRSRVQAPVATALYSAASGLWLKALIDDAPLDHLHVEEVLRTIGPD